MERERERERACEKRRPLSPKKPTRSTPTQPAKKRFPCGGCTFQGPFALGSSKEAL